LFLDFLFLDFVFLEREGDRLFANCLQDVSNVPQWQGA
jgi:hypothetical protein